MGAQTPERASLEDLLGGAVRWPRRRATRRNHFGVTVIQRGTNTVSAVCLVKAHGDQNEQAHSLLPVSGGGIVERDASARIPILQRPDGTGFGSPADPISWALTAVITAADGAVTEIMDAAITVVIDRMAGIATGDMEATMAVASMVAGIMAAATMISDCCSGGPSDRRDYWRCAPPSHGTIMISPDITATRMPTGATPDIVPTGPTIIPSSRITVLGASASVPIRIAFPEPEHLEAITEELETAPLSLGIAPKRPADREGDGRGTTLMVPKANQSRRRQMAVRQLHHCPGPAEMYGL